MANSTQYMSQVLIHNPVGKCSSIFNCGLLAVILCDGPEECEYNVFSVHNDKQIVLQER